MKAKRIKSLVTILALTTLACSALAYSKTRQPAAVLPDPSPLLTNGTVQMTGHLTRNKVLLGGDGRTGLTLTLTADPAAAAPDSKNRPVDMIIVLDRSGSMSGIKIDNARQAALNLLARLSSRDRFALVTYSDGVRTESPLVPVTNSARAQISAAIQSIAAGGGTNLGAGLQEGIRLLQTAEETQNAGRVLLISDGLANQGITDARALAQIASAAVPGEFAVSTVGVGSQFNETLMTTLADSGSGTYYYLENPAAFAAVFRKEMGDARMVAAASMEIRLPLADGISLLDASGYPIERRAGQAVFYPGSLLAGQTRKLFLTLSVPTHRESHLDLHGIELRYRCQGRAHSKTLAQPLHIACVQDREEALASIVPSQWEQKVLQDDYNRLKEEVAQEVKAGNQKAALDRIQKYQAEKSVLNSVVASERVAKNLDSDVGDLKKDVQESFRGSPAEAEEKQRRASKALQYEGYTGRRSKQ